MDIIRVVLFAVLSFTAIAAASYFSAVRCAPGDPGVTIGHMLVAGCPQ